MIESFAYAMAGPQDQSSGGGLIGFLPLILIFLIFYLLLLRPQQKKQRMLQLQIKNMKPGDRIITTGGIHGTVASISENDIMLKIADKVKIKLSKSAIAVVMQGEEGGEKGEN